MLFRFLCFFASSNYILEVLLFIKFSKLSDDNMQNPGKMLDKYFSIRQFVATLYCYQWTLLTIMKLWRSYSDCLLFISLPWTFYAIVYNIPCKNIHRCASYSWNFVNYFRVCLIFSAFLENPATGEKLQMSQVRNVVLKLLKS